MDKRKKHDKYPHNFWDEFFGQSFDEFINMRRNMDKIFHESMKSFNDEDMNKKPFIYGFSVRLGPDGIPHIQQFGNTISGRRGIVGKGIESEREPLTDIIEADDYVAITIELPGIEKDDINMEIFEDYLTINVDIESRKYHKELKLPENLELASIEATCKNGVLDIVIKRKKEKPKKGKKININ